jgi:hypothetical protein
MRKLSFDKTAVILLVKGNIVNGGYDDAIDYITKEVYGVKVMDNHVLCRYLREILMEAREYSLEAWENFHYDATRRAFAWSKEFSWKEYIHYHLAAIQGLRIRRTDGTVLIDLHFTPEDTEKVKKVLTS